MKNENDGGELEKLLQESGQPRELSQILDTLPSGVAIMDLSGRFVYANKAALTILGISSDELAARRFDDPAWKIRRADGGLLPPDQLPFNVAVSERHPALGAEFSVERPDGKRIVLSTNEVPIHDGGGRVEGVISSFVDVSERARTLAALEEERRFVSAVLDTAGALVVLLDTEGRIARFNRTAEKVTGYSASEVIGQPFWDRFLLAEEVEGVRRVFNELKAGQFPNYHENYWRTKAGGLRLIAWSNTVLLNEQGGVQYVIATGLDVTERKEAEEALRRALESLRSSEERYRALAESATDAIISVNEQGRIVFWNKAAEDIFGYTGEEMRGKSLEAIIPEEFRMLHFTAMRRVVETEVSKIIGRTIELTAIRKDGSHFPIELSLARWKTAEGVFFSGVIRDITERKRAEERLRQEKEFSESLVNSSSDGILAFDRDCRYTLWNPQMQEITGLGTEAVVGKCAFDVFPFLKETGERELMRKALEGETVRAGDRSYTIPSGSKRFFEALYAPLLDGEGKIRGGLGVIRDITERREAETLSSTLNDINAAILSTLDPDEIFHRLVKDAAEAMHSESVLVSVPGEGYWEVRHTHGPEAEPLLGLRLSDAQVPQLALAARERRIVSIKDAGEDERVNREVTRKYRIGSQIMVPLVVQAETIAVLTFNYPSHAPPLSQAQLDFASKLGISASLALENAKLYEEEHRIAQVLQESLIRTVPSIRGLEIGLVYGSAYEAERVGGDFYDIFEVGEGQVMVLIGDVSGKGIRAAGMTETIRSSVRALAYINPSPAFVLHSLNEALRRQVPAGEFATAILLLIDIHHGEIVVSTGGHPHPALCDRQCRLLELTPNMILGAFEAGYEQSYLRLDVDQVLVLYTDGLIEARRKGELFGQQRLLKVMSEAHSKDPQEVADKLFAAVEDFSEHRLSDDIAVVALSLRNGQGEGFRATTS